MVDRAMVRDSHKVKDWCSIRGEAELNRMLIFHRMRNLVPLHESIPFAICCTTPRMSTKVIRISYLGWVKFHSFSSSWLNIASARPTHNAYFIHKTVLVRDKMAQIHTNTQRKVIVTSCPSAEWYKTARLCNGTICCTLSSLG